MTQPSSRGFTLIEVMVALAVVAVALAAGLRAASALGGNAQRLQDVVAAQWCADNRLALRQLMNDFPGVGEQEFACEQMGRRYQGRMIVRPAGLNPDFRQLEVSVADEGGQPLVTLMGLASRR